MGKKEKTTTPARKIKILAEAYKDIENIADYIANNNQLPLNAIKVGETIFTAIERIENNPFAYKECEQIVTKTKIYRQSVCLSWLIIYKIKATEIIILGVIHGARNPSKIRKLKRYKSNI